MTYFIQNKQNVLFPIFMKHVNYIYMSLFSFNHATSILQFREQFNWLSICSSAGNMELVLILLTDKHGAVNNLFLENDNHDTDINPYHMRRYTK